MFWFLLFPFCLIFEAFAVILAPILPLFAKDRFGNINNSTHKGIEPRLPLWLSWFDTPDNSLLGDLAHKEKYKDYSLYYRAFTWLLRNRAYGFKWKVLAASVKEELVIKGNPSINRNNATFGTLWITSGKYWQYKIVKPIAFTNYCLMLNFGWLLDARTTPALYLFSPRIAKIKKG